jgi:hypothetical protein
MSPDQTKNRLQSSYSNQATTSRGTPQEGEVKMPEKDERIPVNGFSQVLEMLKVADPAFRESLLRRIAVKDRTLAQSLRKDLAFLGLSN